MPSLTPRVSMHSITIYCPDSHLTYDRPRLDQKGVGGGATTRVRMAYALAKRGHRVLLYINCPKERTECGVETRHFSSLKQDRSDIFIASTSGGQLDLSNLKTVDLGEALKVLLVHGVACPKGLEVFPFEYVYAPSNFIRRIGISEWGLSPEKNFVTHRAVHEEYFHQRLLKVHRDPFALVYSGHPSKGLETAVAILRSLREVEPRIHLHVYAGAGLWGEADEDLSPETGITFHGIIGQRQLAREMQRCSFSLNLQVRQEPFGMVVIEAMRAGCIVLASPIGAYPETIVNGENGFLIPGDPAGEATRRQVVELILGLVRNSAYVEYLHRNAVRTPLTWDQVARTWEGHWEWCLSGKTNPTIPGVGMCNECQGVWLPLADGLHCIRCGNYQRNS